MIHTHKRTKPLKRPSASERQTAAYHADIFKATQRSGEKKFKGFDPVAVAAKEEIVAATSMAQVAILQELSRPRLNPSRENIWYAMLFVTLYVVSNECIQLAAANDIPKINPDSNRNYEDYKDYEYEEAIFDPGVISIAKETYTAAVTYAQSLSRFGKHAEAIEFWQQYKEAHKGESSLKTKVNDQIMIQQWLSDPKNSLSAIIILPEIKDNAMPIVPPKPNLNFKIEELKFMSNPLTSHELGIMKIAEDAAQVAKHGGYKVVADMLRHAIGLRNKDDTRNAAAFYILEMLLMNMLHRQIFFSNEPRNLETLIEAVMVAKIASEFSTRTNQPSESFLIIAKVLNRLRLEALQELMKNENKPNDTIVKIPLTERPPITTTVGELKKAFSNSEYYLKLLTEIKLKQVRKTCVTATVSGVVTAAVVVVGAIVLTQKWKHRRKRSRAYRAAFCNVRRLQDSINQVIQTKLDNNEIPEVAKKLKKTTDQLIEMIIGHVLKKILNIGDHDDARLNERLFVSVKTEDKKVCVTFSPQGKNPTEFQSLKFDDKKIISLIGDFLNNIKANKCTAKIAHAKPAEVSVPTHNDLPSQEEPAPSSAITIATLPPKLASSYEVDSFVEQKETLQNCLKTLQTNIGDLLDITKQIQQLATENDIFLEQSIERLIELIKKCNHDIGTIITRSSESTREIDTIIAPKQETGEKLSKLIEDEFREIKDTALPLVREEAEQLINIGNSTKKGRRKKLEEARNKEIPQLTELNLAEFFVFPALRKTLAKKHNEINDEIDRKRKLEEARALKTATKPTLEQSASKTSDCKPIIFDLEEEQKAEVVKKQPAPYIKEIGLCLTCIEDELGNMLERLKSGLKSANAFYIGSHHAIRFLLIRLFELTIAHLNTQITRYSTKLDVIVATIQKLKEHRGKIVHSTYDYGWDNFNFIFNNIKRCAFFANTRKSQFEKVPFDILYKELQLIEIPITEIHTGNKPNTIIDSIKKLLISTLDTLIILKKAYNESDKNLFGEGGVLRNYLFYTLSTIGAIVHDLKIINENKKNPDLSREANDLLKQIKNNTPKSFIKLCQVIRNNASHVITTADPRYGHTYDPVDDILEHIQSESRTGNKTTYTDIKQLLDNPDSLLTICASLLKILDLKSCSSTATNREELSTASTAPMLAPAPAPAEPEPTSALAPSAKFTLFSAPTTQVYYDVDAEVFQPKQSK